MNITTKCIDIIKRYKGWRSYEKFTDEINLHLPDGHGNKMPHWQKVATGTYPPNFFVLYYLSKEANGWVQEFANEILAVLKS